MAHRVHPKIFRIKKIEDWDSRWLDIKNIAKNLEEDFKIREYIKKKFGKLEIDKIEIERSSSKINIIISTSRPGLIIGRGGEGVEKLRKEIEKICFKDAKKDSKKEVRLEVREIKNPWLSATFAANWAAQQIEKRMPYKKILRQLVDKISSQKGVEGCRVEFSGRLDGNEIARREWLRVGRLPRQNLRADIDYAQSEAFCTYGVVGIKVWIYKGEKFD
jgi:small subunit ribosomal protein S3